MGLLDDLRKVMTEAVEAAQRAAEEEKRRQAGKIGGAASPSGREDAAARRSPSGEPAASGGGTFPQGRVGGRLQRESLERVAPAAPAMPSEPSGEDFRHKVEAMESGEPAALGALPAAPFDLDLTGDEGVQTFPVAGTAPAAPPFTLDPRDVLRAVLLGEVLDEPKGRRARRPHPK